MRANPVTVLAVVLAVLAGKELSAAPVPENLSAKECLARGISMQKTGSVQAAKDALALYDRAIALDPKLSEAHMRAGAIRMSFALSSNDRKRLETAISLFSRCAELEPKRPRCHVLLSDAYGFKGDRASARKSAEKACALEESAWCKSVRSGKVQPSIEEIHRSLSAERRLKPEDLAGIP